MSPWSARGNLADDFRVLLLDKNKNQILVYVKNIEGYWSPYNGATFKMITNDNS